jgi:hypothetical protein
VRLAVFAVAGMALALVAPRVSVAAPGLTAGVVEDDARSSTLVQAEARMTTYALTGYRAVRVTSYWRPGLSRPSDDELEILQNTATAADHHGIRLYVTVMSPGSATTPLSAEAQTQFASYAAAIVRDVPQVRNVIIGNEPNLNRFWLPQFALDGSSAAPAAYLSLLARTYDALKAVSPSVEVIGGAVSPRGTDRPDGIRPTHSPTLFIQQLGAAYRASGRTKPVMDAFSMHVYADNSSMPPAAAHPNTTAVGIGDYEKLVALLAAAFDGTAQAGSNLPILYGEYGVESQIPSSKAALYTGTEPTTTKPVPESTQADYYRQAIALSFCQPNVEGILLFLVNDERARAAWQSGLYFVDGTPKSSRAPVTRALNSAAGGSITRCPGVQLPVHALGLRFGTRSAARRGIFRTSWSCDLDCRYQLRLENAVTHATKMSKRGQATVGAAVRVEFKPRRLARGTYRYTLTLVHPVNPAPPTVRLGPSFTLP